MSDKSLLFDISMLSGCYYAPSGNNYGLGRVAVGFAERYAKLYPDEFGICSSYFSAEAGLLLKRDYPHLDRYCIEPDASAAEMAIIRFVDLGDPLGGMRLDLWSKVKRKLWRKWDDGARWRMDTQAKATYKSAKLIHSELHVPAAHRSPNAKRVFTIHDLISVRESSISKAEKSRFTFQLHEAWNAGAHFCCDSQYTADDLADFLGVTTDRITSAPLGLDPVFKPIRDDECLAEWKAKLGINPDERYIIAQTGQIKRKNLVGVISTVHSIRKEADQPNLLLVLAGGIKNLRTEFESQVPEHIDWKEFVRFTGQIPDAEFPILYSGAELMLFLSWAEGFGLPPLEAMACGVPVVCSDRTSLPEVIGEAALLVNPADPSAVATATLHILRSSAIRAELIHKGLIRASEMTWEATCPHLKKAWDIALES